MSRAAKLLGVDIIASLAVVAWYEWAPWVDLYGLAAGHWRTALEFFYWVVCAGWLLFAAVFLLMSCLLFFSGEFALRPLNGIFYGTGRAMVAKYAALFLSVLLGPYVYLFFWRQFGGHAAEIIVWGLPTTILMFVAAAFAIRLLGPPARQASAG